jgi:hypothetical protein
MRDHLAALASIWPLGSAVGGLLAASVERRGPYPRRDLIVVTAFNMEAIPGLSDGLGGHRLEHLDKVGVRSERMRDRDGVQQCSFMYRRAHALR